MTDRGAFAGTKPITWPRAAIGAALFAGLMIVLLIVIPNQLLAGDSSQSKRIITIVYVVAIFAIVVWLVATWQNRGLTAPQPVAQKQKVSAFGRPMREGPGFASFAEKAAPNPQMQPKHMKRVDAKPVENTSSFGRPLKKRSQ